MRNKLVVQFQHQGYKSSTHISPNLIWMSRSKVYFLGTSIESMTYLHQIIYTLKIFEGRTGRLPPLLCVVTPWEKFRETIYQISQSHPKLELIFQRLAVPPILLLISWFSGKWPKSVEERIALETLHLQLFLPTESWLVKRNAIKKNSINLRTSLQVLPEVPPLTQRRKTAPWSIRRHDPMDRNQRNSLARSPDTKRGNIGHIDC